MKTLEVIGMFVVMLLLIISLFVMIGCNRAQSADYSLKCQIVTDMIYRCENDDTVCYKYLGYGISCWRK